MAVDEPLWRELCATRFGVTTSCAQATKVSRCLGVLLRTTAHAADAICGAGDAAGAVLGPPEGVYWSGVVCLSKLSTSGLWGLWVRPPTHIRALC